VVIATLYKLEGDLMISKTSIEAFFKLLDKQIAQLTDEDSQIVTFEMVLDDIPELELETSYEFEYPNFYYELTDNSFLFILDNMAYCIPLDRIIHMQEI
jgi:hypothetical protein